MKQVLDPRAIAVMEVPWNLLVPEVDRNSRLPRATPPETRTAAGASYVSSTFSRA